MMLRIFTNNAQKKNRKVCHVLAQLTVGYATRSAQSVCPMLCAKKSPARAETTTGVQNTAGPAQWNWALLLPSNDEWNWDQLVPNSYCVRRLIITDVVKKAKGGGEKRPKGLRHHTMQESNAACVMAQFLGVVGFPPSASCQKIVIET